MSNQLKVLMELRPCFDGFAGIPQDTRITYNLLSQLDNIALHGHVLDRGISAAGFPWKSNAGKAAALFNMSQYIGLLEEGRAKNGVLSKLSRGSALPELLRTAIYNLINLISPRQQQLHAIDAEFFSDYLWRKLFEKTLKLEDRERILDTKFWGSSMGWAQMNSALVYGWPALRLDTRPWDIYISQTPFPGQISPSTQLVVRFHDAMPIQLPHTVYKIGLHQKLFFSALKRNAPHAHFVCNSASTQTQLLKLFPEVESRSHIVPCCLTDDFYPEPADAIENIIAKRSASLSEKGPASPAPQADMKGRYLLAVGTMEPRKNYNTLIDAWDQLCNTPGDHPSLVLIANPGWNSEALIKKIKQYQSDAMRKTDSAPTIYVLQGVPIYELRKLYSSASAVVVPSYGEGFSYSGIEGMLCNAPVIASNIETHQEVYGDHARYFNPYSPESLMHALQAHLSEPANHLAETTRNAAQYAMQYTSTTISKAWDNTLENIRHVTK
ncbi:MAG: glycosyltransferase family 4 protein [Pseudomonadales bacterium]|nr:glycosyltransferase family 4 protein [Pseudomonadales bacterium]